MKRIIDRNRPATLLEQRENRDSQSVSTQSQENGDDFCRQENRSVADRLAAVPSWFVSMTTHTVIILVLALITIDNKIPTGQISIFSDPTEETFEEEYTDEFWEEPLDIEVAGEMTNFELASIVPISESTFAVAPAPDSTEAAAVQIDLSSGDTSEDKRLSLGTSASVFGNSSGAFQSRTGPHNRVRGVTEASEKAVAYALAWIAEHQLPDGSWSFNHQICQKCKGQCRNPGSMLQARNAATALAILPFLGAGQTHQKGRYAKAVRGGLYYLANHGKIQDGGVSFFEPEGRMYSHGLAAICMTEGYAMTKDRALLGPAQGAINFIAFAQDPIGGGWRYAPKQEGDTSVVGWQLMGLKSGYMAYLKVDQKTIANAARFLDSVQANSGANYGYTEPGSGSATTAIGLLSRMYLGWKRDNPALEQGLQWLAKNGPSKDNNYYNYYATQTMRQYNGPLWKGWDTVMREQLVNTQMKTGHEKGSWATKGPHASNGGRLYDTALSAMILEVYYRHMPIYQNSAVVNEFPL